MFHLRNRKRPPEKGKAIVARCGYRAIYTGNIFGIDVEECCPKCLAKGKEDKNAYQPLYIIPESEADIKASKWGHLWRPAS